MLDLVPLLIGGHVLDAVVCGQIDEPALLQVFRLQQSAEVALRGGGEDHVAVLCCLRNIRILTLLLDQLVKSREGSGIVLSLIAAGAVMQDLHILPLQKKAHQLASCVTR